MAAYRRSGTRRLSACRARAAAAPAPLACPAASCSSGRALRIQCSRQSQAPEVSGASLAFLRKPARELHLQQRAGQRPWRHQAPRRRENRRSKPRRSGSRGPSSARGRPRSARPRSHGTGSARRTSRGRRTGSWFRCSWRGRCSRGCCCRASSSCCSWSSWRSSRPPPAAAAARPSGTCRGSDTPRRSSWNAAPRC